MDDEARQTEETKVKKVRKKKKSSEGELRQDYVPSKEPYLVNKLTAYRVYLSGEFNPSSTHKTLSYLLLSPHV